MSQLKVIKDGTELLVSFNFSLTMTKDTKMKAFFLWVHCAKLLTGGWPFFIVFFPTELYKLASVQ